MAGRSPCLLTASQSEEETGGGDLEFPVDVHSPVAIMWEETHIER